MATIKTLYGRPVLVQSETGIITRDRDPDYIGGEIIEFNPAYATVKEVELTHALAMTLLEDLAYVYGKNTDKFREKLTEFDLIKNL